ncbi:hypothetical protein [Natranaerobius thermophilus]|uniref:Uncharacterized protein n=1 Tax=Natranaerobius thermophilus (strain ATCC BAA-1301 / DSM 18059 / JW/NM-WN-LF) TaxID=457570 RepID=B2A8P3_NATTJ|nr:hypothetical protein [Natranaerobius thermophilus]ACB86492.1 hypothetical protein Nther_2947 [Natranaerobius thermophilus JW/NM-WN-LF]
MTKKTQLILVGIILILGMTVHAIYEELNDKQEKTDNDKEQKEEVQVSITEEVKTETTKIIEDYNEVVDTTIEKEANDITLYLVIHREADAKQLGEDFIRSFASNASIHGEGDIEGPDSESLGGIWEHYSGDIYIGYDADPFLHGVIQDTRDNIRWFEI